MDQIMHQLEICATDYEIVRQVVERLHETPADEHQIDRIAAELGHTQRQLTDLFRRWAGLTPKAFSQCITLDRARQMLKSDLPIFDASLELGLSSPARLYDLFVTHEAMPPGFYKAKGEGLEIRYGFHPSPFGQALLMITDYGLAGLAFADKGKEPDVLLDMQSRWPKATYIQQHAETAKWADRVFLPGQWQQDQPIRVAMIGTDFEVRVWQTLLKIKPGEADSYGAIAQQVGSPKGARAVGAAVGRNPISFVVPCHRVIGKNAALTGYHWGLTRKKAMLGWEAGQLQGSAG